MPSSTKPPNGPHPLIIEWPVLGAHEFEAADAVGFLDRGTEDEIVFAWDDEEKVYVNGTRRLRFFDDGTWWMTDSDPSNPSAEFGTWT